MKAIVAFMLFLLLLHSGHSVPVMPTEEELEGEVVGYSVVRAELLNIKPSRMVLYELTIRPKERLKFSHRGYIRVLSKRHIPSWVFGRTLRVKVEYRGDERGGLLLA